MTTQDERAIHDQLRSALRAVAATAVLDREPPPLTSVRGDVEVVAPLERARRRPARALALAAAVALAVAGVASVVGARGDDASELATAAADTTTAVPAATATAVADRPPVLMAALPELDGKVHELWAYRRSDGSACAVTSFVERGERMVSGNDCETPDACVHQEWAALTWDDGLPLRDYPLPCDPSARQFSSFGAVLGDPAVDPIPQSGDGFGAMRDSSQATPDGTGGYAVAPIGTLWGRLDPDVAMWEMRSTAFETIGPLPAIRHPDDPSTAYLFASGPSPWVGAEIILRDESGEELDIARYPGPGLP
jgi:hypothetical protein